MKIKILVGYYKKDKLFESDVIVPIHCGRRVCLENTRYGQVDDNDVNWLINNMIGDDTGDNISEMNRDIDELSGIYWAWKNYDKIGNPDYIGLYHYRRFLNLKEISSKYTGGSEINQTGNNIKNIKLILQQYDFIYRKGIPSNSAPYISFECYQPKVNLSNNYHPKIFEGYQEFLKEGKFYANDIFIMKKEDFFAMCEECFPIMFDYINNNSKQELISSWLDWYKKNLDEKTLQKINNIIKTNNGWYPALTGFMMEYIFSFYFAYLKNRRKSIECDIINPLEITHKTLLKKIFSIDKKQDNKKIIVTFLGVKITITKKSKEIIK